VLLVYGVVAAVWAGVGIVEFLTQPGASAARVVGLLFRIGNPMIALWLAWFVFRQRADG
jgi:hypothetical protein